LEEHQFSYLGVWCAGNCVLRSFSRPHRG